MWARCDHRTVTVDAGVEQVASQNTGRGQDLGFRGRRLGQGGLKGCRMVCSARVVSQGAKWSAVDCFAARSNKVCLLPTKCVSFQQSVSPSNSPARRGPKVSKDLDNRCHACFASRRTLLL
eukprot:60403-Chlamydomonas_euryale.AAC.1